MPAASKPTPPSSETNEKPAEVSWLVRISEAFSGIANDVLKAFGATSIKRLGTEYYWIKTSAPDAVRQSKAAVFARWNLPLHHAWPCNPSKIDGFLDKAAQGVMQKFAAGKPQAVLVGALNPGSPDRYFKNLAANLRDRLLHLMPDVPVHDPEAQSPDRDTLFCLVGKEGVFCGLASPRACNGFHPGGSKFISTSSADTISRAGAKIAEALHYLGLYRLPMEKGARWLELGACPGGMTSELLRRHFHVTAIDVAALDKRLDDHPGLNFVRANVMEYQPNPHERFDALLCDMNGPPFDSIAQVIRLARHLQPRGLVVFTLKLTRVESVGRPLALMDDIISEAGRGGLRLFAKTHLTYNRHEFTLFFEPKR